MSWDFFNTTSPIARKDYPCDACEWLINTSPDFLSEEEKALFKEAEEDNFKIRKGTAYMKLKGKWDGEFSVFRARPEINEICMRHRIYQD